MKNMNRYKKGLIYVFISNIINMIIGVFTSFVLPKMLSIESYSSIKLFQLYITYVGLCHFGFSDGVFLNYGGKNIKDLKKDNIVSEFCTFRLFQLFTFIVILIISIIIKNEMLLFFSFIVIPINLGSYIKNLYISIGEFKKYAFFSNIDILIIFFINIFLIFIVKTDNYYIFIIGYIIGYIIYWLILENINKNILNKIWSKPNIVYLKKYIKIGFPLLIANLFNVIFTSIDKIFVKLFFSLKKFGLYSFSVSIEGLMNLIIVPISTVMYNFLCKNKNKNLIINLKRLIIVFGAFLISACYLARFIIFNYLEKYSSSVFIIFILICAQYCSIIVRIIYINLYKADFKQQRYFNIMSIIVLISILLNIISLLISKNIIYISLATLITNIIWFLICEIEYKKYRLKIKDYIYYILVIFSFFSIYKFNIGILDFLTYILIISILTFIFMKDIINTLILKLKNIFNLKK